MLILRINLTNETLHKPCIDKLYRVSYNWGRQCKKYERENESSLKKYNCGHF